MKLRVATTVRGGTIELDERAFALVWKRGSERATAPVRYPSGGYGGAELVLGPGERHLAVYLFTGQSEHGWELFALEPELTHVGALWAFGEGYPPVFSPDGALVVMASTGPLAWFDETGESYDDVDPDSRDAPWRVEWATVHLQHVATGAIERRGLRVELGAQDDLEPEQLEAPTKLVFTGPRRLAMTLPWGDVGEVDLESEATTFKLVR